MKILKIIVVLPSYLIRETIASVPPPKVKVTVHDGQFSDMYGLNPTVSWSNTNEVGNLYVDYGIESDIRVTKDIASLPKKFWGKVSSTVGAWGVFAKADFQGIDYTNSDISLGATHADQGLKFNAEGGVSSAGIILKKIEVTKAMEQEGANFIINPSFDLQSEEAAVIVSYDKDGTGVELEASKNAQTVTLSRQVDDENRISPKINNTGEFSLEWEHQLSGDSIVTTTFEPQKSIKIAWEDRGWKANISMDIDKKDITNVNVSVKKDVVF